MLHMSSHSPLKWSLAQEKTINRDYPFVIDRSTETLEQFVIRNYLQFLWLPNSIMPLNMLVPVLLYFNFTSSCSTETSHPLLIHLEPLLMGSRATANKFHVELSQILSGGGGTGEIEEAMMWHALKHEKADGDKLISRDKTVKDDLWRNETWRTGWLDRLEKREVQIQILLQFLKISLEQPRIQSLTDQDRLESLMDKLSMWQLMDRVEATQDRNQTDKRDWMQIFCEDIVDSQFILQLPELCSLLRSKVFPHSPFSEDPSSSSNPPSPSGNPCSANNVKLAKSSRSTHMQHQFSPKSTADSSQKTSWRDLDHSRFRSRSLSVTLAQDSNARRAASVGTKRQLSREVNMSRNFKTKANDNDGRSATDKRKPYVGPSKGKTELGIGVTLVAATPKKSKFRTHEFPM